MRAPGWFHCEISKPNSLIRLQLWQRDAARSRLVTRNVVLGRNGSRLMTNRQCVFERYLETRFGLAVQSGKRTGIAFQEGLPENTEFQNPWLRPSCNL